MYRVVLTTRAQKDWESLEDSVQSRLSLKLRQYSLDPLKHARKLINSSIGTYRFRIGDFRVIFDLTDDELVVLRVGHRRGIYR